MYYLNRNYMVESMLWVLEDWIYLYYLNLDTCHHIGNMFLRTEFICIIWTIFTILFSHVMFLRTEFICIIWTTNTYQFSLYSSWGLNLFVLFELHYDERLQIIVLEDWIYLYYLNRNGNITGRLQVLEDWIYLYYLNQSTLESVDNMFLRTEFICIIWTCYGIRWTFGSSWGLNLFVLFEQVMSMIMSLTVLEDWIYLYYLNNDYYNEKEVKFLRTEFICIIWTEFR